MYDLRLCFLIDRSPPRAHPSSYLSAGTAAVTRFAHYIIIIIIIIHRNFDAVCVSDIICYNIVEAVLYWFTALCHIIITIEYIYIPSPSSGYPASFTVYAFNRTKYRIVLTVVILWTCTTPTSIPPRTHATAMFNRRLCRQSGFWIFFVFPWL